MTTRANAAILALMVMTTTSIRAVADEAEVPTFVTQPIFFAQRTGHSVTGQLLLGDIDARSTKFHLWVGGFGGGHLCTVSGRANSTDGRWYEFIEPNCHLSFRIDGKTVYAIDISKHCSNEGQHCGYRAGIDPMQLHAAPLSQSTYWRPFAKAKR